MILHQRPRVNVNSSMIVYITTYSAAVMSGLQLQVNIILLQSPVAYLCVLNIIAERLSTRQLILLRISFCVDMFVCMFVTLRNANFLCAAAESIRHAHAAALFLSHQHGKCDGSICELTSTSMDNRPYRR